MNSAKYDRIAPLYDFLDSVYEMTWKGPLRKQVFAGVHGRVLDVGIGTGCNIPYYPPDAEVVGIDASTSMLRQAETRSGKLRRPVACLEMDLLKTTFPDNSFDCVVATFVFCTLPDEVQLAALREMRRICKPDGQIRLLDYTKSERPLQRLKMRILSVWMRMVFAGTYDPRMERYVAKAGLEIAETRLVRKDIVKLAILKPSASWPRSPDLLPESAGPAAALRYKTPSPSGA